MILHERRHFPCLGVSRGAGVLARWIAFSLSLSVTSAALAEAPTKTSGAPTKEDAATLVSAGDQARVDGRFVDAEASYRRAIAIAPDDATSLRLALCLAAEGKQREAADLLARLADTSSALTETDRARAEAALADARRELATIDVRVDAGALVDLDGAILGAAPIARTLHVDPGLHVVRASRDGYLAAQAAIDARKGHGYVVKLPLLRAPAEPERPSPESMRWLSPLESLYGSTGQLRGAGMILGATLLVGGGAALGIARENDDLVDAHRRIHQLRGTPSCFDALPKADPDCRRLAQSIDASAVATTAAAVLFSSAGAVITATALTWLLSSTRRAPVALVPSVTLNAASAPMGGGLSLEASW